MGWLRTNWLDALIFLLVAVIMAGVVFFLTGVNPLTAFQGGQGQTAPVLTPSAPKPAQPAPAAPQGTKPQSPNPAPATPKPQAQPEPNPNPGSDSEPVVTVLPSPPDTARPEAKPVPAPPKVTDQVGAQPQAKNQPQTSTAPVGADRGGAWRVVVGSFSDPANASRLAAGLRNRGYPAGLETAGSYTRVWVGPYADQARAQSVASGLSQYSPKIVGAPARANPQGQPAASPGGGRLLQVGAYKSREGAAPVLAKVKEAGYDAVLVEENGLVKVRVGPLGDVAAAKAALQAKGLDVLEVR